jgi:hypothetical protein
MENTMSALVVGSGDYSGGGFSDTVSRGFSWFTTEWSPPRWLWGIIIVFLIVLFVLVLLPNVSGYRDRNGATLRHIPTLSHGPYGTSVDELLDGGRSEGFGGMSRDQRAASLMSEGFYGDRTAPHFANATNRVLNKEDRERGAVRALGKINQERLRRATADEDSTTPLPWGPFWSEWKKTHPMDGEPGYEGFSAKKDLVPY